MTKSIFEVKGEPFSQEKFLDTITSIINQLKKRIMVAMSTSKTYISNPDALTHTIPLYIVTTNECDDFVYETLESQHFFNYAPIIIFPLDDLALLTSEGQMVLETKTKIKKRSMGYGGVLKSMYKRNLVIKDM
jgi:hypothetical protein